MFSLFCKGLHCAGCGRGLPLSLVLVLVLSYASTNKNVDQIMGQTILEASLALASAFAVGSIVISLLVKWIIKNQHLTVISTQLPADQLTYSEMKFLQTGEVKWLRLTGRQPFAILGEVDDATSHSKELDIVDNS